MTSSHRAGVVGADAGAELVGHLARYHLVEQLVGALHLSLHHLQDLLQLLALLTLLQQAGALQRRATR